jgi:hypothetical protein
MGKVLDQTDELRFAMFTLCVVSDADRCLVEIGEAYSRKKTRIEGTGFRKTPHPQINVVEQTPHMCT